MSYDTESVTSIDQLFRLETCQEKCPDWQVSCFSLPCRHCLTTDLDENIQCMDQSENEEKMELVYRVMKNEVNVYELELPEEEIPHFLARVTRFIRVALKWKRLNEEGERRLDQLFEQ